MANVETRDELRRVEPDFTVPADVIALFPEQVAANGDTHVLRIRLVVGPKNLDVEAPNLVVEAKSLGVEAPSLVVEAKSLGVEAPSLVVEAKSLGVEAKSLGVEAKSLGIEAPSLVVEAKSLGIEAPSLVVEAKSLGVEAPSLVVEAKSLVDATKGRARPAANTITLHERRFSLIAGRRKPAGGNPALRRAGFTPPRTG